jgi:hypothetical protein
MKWPCQKYRDLSINSYYDLRGCSKKDIMWAWDSNHKYGCLDAGGICENYFRATLKLKND